MHVQGDDTNTPPRELAQHARDEVVRVTSCKQCTSAFCRGCCQSSVSARAWGSHDPPSQSRGCGAVADSALLCPLILGGRLRHLSWMLPVQTVTGPSQARHEHAHLTTPYTFGV